MVQVGYWKTADEAAKLSQYFLTPGMVDEHIKMGNPAGLIPSIRAGNMGLGVLWNRSKIDNSTLASDIAVQGLGKIRVLKTGMEIDQMTATLKACNVSVPLDKFTNSIWKTVNDYEEDEFKNCQDGLLKKLGDKVIYDNETYNSIQMAGLHEIAARNYTSVAANQLIDIDGGETAFSIANLRKLRREMKYGVDHFLVPTWFPDYLGAAYQEHGFAALASGTAGTFGQISFTTNEIGMRVYSFDGIPLIPSDYMCAEQANTGVGSNARAKNTSGTAQYSLFGVKRGIGGIGQVSPGLRLLFGNVPDERDFFTFEYFDKSETIVDTKLMGLTTYTQHIPGSKYSVGRIFDFTMAAITA